MMKGISEAGLSEIEDVDQLKSKLDKRTKNKPKAFQIDNMLFSRDSSENEIFEMFKERLLEAKANRGVKTKLKFERAELDRSMKRVERTLKEKRREK